MIHVKNGSIVHIVVFVVRGVAHRHYYFYSDSVVVCTSELHC